MKPVVRAYENGDHSCIVWFPKDFKAIPDCRGFGIRRKRTRAGKTTTEFVRNFVGFTDDAPPAAAGQEWTQPIQRYLWWDYFVREGDVVRYSVVPVVGSFKDGTLALAESDASPFTAAVTISGQTSKSVAAYFNKGIIAAQWVARELKEEADRQAAAAAAAATANKPSPKVLLGDLIADPQNHLRIALSGLLRRRILRVLADADAQGDTVYAALYELNDPELIPALVRLGERAHVILANGAFDAATPDENADARKTLHASRVQVFDRMVKSPHFAHNKFLVVCDPQGDDAHTVVTGSTNWTKTGLCTQANNALIVTDAAVAQAYRDEWDEILAAGNGYPPTFVQANTKKKSFKVDRADVTVWFVPTEAREDMIDARRVIDGAKDGILFLFFNPGKQRPKDKPDEWTLLQSIVSRQDPASGARFDGRLYVRGVVNQTIAGLTEGAPGGGAGASTASTHPVEVHAGRKTPLKLTPTTLVPAAIKAKFGHWEQELLSMGVMVHSKCVVVDPFGKHPALITGSHNLGVKASEENDDNMVIVEGPGARESAVAYAVNIIAIFQEYRFRHYAATHADDPTAFHHLADDDKWQNGHLSGERREMEFWAGK
jgi:phosphatidylserine/phosphatidylglycerophosphate/cardiolipin synthase-like enzyme